ncbi:Zinc finger, PHD-finger [Dillenia turbinata]|uniref:Zinc finger, PHD-finger n=1 Tax=Dillenia turbinata TaxID=194707 RepID=A0AAN8ZQA7_9MAGN
MPGAQKKLTNQKSGECCFSKSSIGSKLIALLEKAGKSEASQIKSCKSKIKSHGKKLGLNMSKTKTANVTSKEIRKETVNKNQIKRSTQHETQTSSKKLKSLYQGAKNFSFPKSKGHQMNENGDIKIHKRRKRRKHRKENVQLDEASRLQRRTRYLLIKMKLEQNLIDAYSGEGWKGQSREKIKPEMELQRARKQILKCKLGIREAIHQLDLLSSEGCMENSAIAPDGSVYHEHIICAKCKLREAFPDNDIILCDGTCNCAFHQKCLDPPLATENIPPDDQGWLCRFCECKMDIIEAMNAHIGTHFSVDSNWQEIFKEEAALSDGGDVLLNPEEDWPSDDSEDGDYDPEKNNNGSCSRQDSDNSSSDETSSSCSLSWSVEGQSPEAKGGGKVFRRNYGNCIDIVDSDGSTDAEILSGRRQRRAVDYKKLYDEMFGKDVAISEQFSEDEDWGPGKRKRSEKESDAASMLMALCGSDKICPSKEKMEMQNGLPPKTQIKRRIFRIPPDAVEKLRLAFAENELPSRAVKEDLSKQLGLEPEKVDKWFKNARYLALKTRKGKGEEDIQSSMDEHKSDIVKNSTIDLSTSRDPLITSLIHTSKNLKKLRQGKKAKHTTCAPVIQKESFSRGSPFNSNQETMDFSDDVSLKKQFGYLKAKAKTKKREKVKDGGGLQESTAETELERLCQIQNRLENLKQTLQRLPSKSSKSSLDEPRVIYVPVAELKERF